jgi:hypothetical protein
MVRSSLGGSAATPVLLRAGFALGTDGIARLARLRRRGTRLALPLTAFRTLTASSAAASTPPSAARFAVLAAVLGGLSFPGLPGFSWRCLALRLVLIHVGGFSEG